MQGFRKIETDKWEFANEGFVRGQRNLLKTIQRRKSHHSSNEDGKLGGEIESLRKERSLVMEEVVELQDQQRGTAQHIRAVNEKVEAAEREHKRTVSFLAKLLENPAFLAQQKSITWPRTKRKFVELGTFVKYQPNFAAPHLGDGPVFGAEHEPFGVEDSGEDDGMVNELLHGRGDESLLTLETRDAILEQNVAMSPQLQSESAMVLEEAGVFSYVYDLPDLGIPDVWGIERWLDED